MARVDGNVPGEALCCGKAGATGKEKAREHPRGLWGFI